MQQLPHDSAVGKRQLFTTQLRQQKLRPILSEFGHVLVLAVSLEDASKLHLEKLCPKAQK